MSGQSVRPSQFITTYGPGSILESREGPRIIPSLEGSQIYQGLRLTDFEITDQRLSRALDNCGILRLPTNAELGLPEFTEIYRTYAFPSWSLCVTHGILYRVNRNTRTGCPRCTRPGSDSELFQKARVEAIRFVRACRDGHLDDLDWVSMTSHTHPACTPSYLRWEGGGGALRNVNIICPQCGGSFNLGEAYSREWPCTGRLPEYGYDRPGCNEKARIIQRGAANVRIPELRSAITIPRLDTRLHTILGKSPILSALEIARPASKADLIALLERLKNRGTIGEAVVTEVRQYPEPAILSAVKDVLEDSGPSTQQSFLGKEFEELMQGASRGAPAVPSQTPGAPPYFEIIRNNVRTFTLQGGRALRITPVTRLRVVLVQTGYRRLETTGNRVISTAYNDGTRNWYPGVELFGEGIFIDLDPANFAAGRAQHFPFQGPEAERWFSAWRDPDSYRQQIFSEEQRDMLHPVFVWWHTLAHRIISSLSVDSGYSSAAIRERVYTIVDHSTESALGGILLYTTQPGGDGTLGGLTALVPRFDRVLSAALRNIDACSNDPLCGEESFAPGKYNGSACYACLLISETSCEHRNMRLDRNLLMGNLP